MATKRGITPIIATILILMMAVAAAGAMFYWLSRVQGQMQGSTEQSESVLFERMAACVALPSFDYEIINNTAKVVVQNCGSSEWKVGDGDKILITNGAACSGQLNVSNCNPCPTTLPPGGLFTMNINFSASGISCAPFAQGILHQFTIYIDQVATTSVNFVPKAGTLPLTCGVSLSSPPDQGPGCGISPCCYNYTITNTGNSGDVFGLTLTDSPTMCSLPPTPLAFTGWGCIGSPTASIPVSANSTNIFSVEHLINLSVSPNCTVTVNATSTNCPAVSTTDSFTST